MCFSDDDKKFPLMDQVLIIKNANKMQKLEEEGSETLSMRMYHRYGTYSIKVTDQLPKTRVEGSKRCLDVHIFLRFFLRSTIVCLMSLRKRKFL